MTHSAPLTLDYTAGRPRWRTAVEWAAAILLAAMWVAAGIWKLSDVTATQVRMTQALVPRAFSMLAAVGFGTLETLAAILLLVPVWRRWGGWLSAFLLSAFIVYIGYHYRDLTGADCNCFPWLQRVVGPMFFISDGALLGLAILAAWAARPSRHLRGALGAFAAVALFAGSMWALDQSRNSGAVGPASIQVDGREYSLRQGKVMLFFFNPSCIHCLAAARTMAKMNWEAPIIGIPTQDFEQGKGFLEDSGLTRAQLSPDLAKLLPSFPFKDVPFAAALENGRLKEKFVFFEEPEYGSKLRQIGFVK